MKPLVALSLFLLGGLMLQAAAEEAPAASIVDKGDGTYVCTREATTTFGRDVQKLAAEAQEEAAKFCAAKGLELKVLSITVNKPWMTLGIPKATVVFRALEPGDPALLDKTPVPVVRVGRKGKTSEAVGAAPTPVAPPPDDLYTELLKLDDLRKKGILTDEEFQTLKAKAIGRAK